MTVQCVTCANFDLRSAGKIASCGFGACARRRRGSTVSADYPRQCSAHQPADQSMVDSRVRWIAKERAALAQAVRAAA